MKRNINIFLVALVAMFSLSCHHDASIDMGGNSPSRDGYLRIDFDTRCSDMTEVATRAVDPDGVGVQDLTLFCFDAYGIFRTTVKASIKQDEPQPSVRGSFSAEVPAETRRIHFLANQNMTYVDETKFQNLTEAATMAAMRVRRVRSSTGVALPVMRTTRALSTSNLSRTCRRMARYCYIATTRASLSPTGTPSGWR